MTGRILLTLLLVCGIGCTKKNDIVSVSKKVEAPVVAKIYLNLKEGQGEPTFTYERVSRFKSSKGRDNTKKRRRDGYNEIEPIPVNTSVDVVMYSGAFSYNPRFDIAGDPGFSIVSSTCDGATAPCETVIRFSPTTVGTYWTDFLLSIGSAVIHHEFDAWAYDQVEEPDCPRCEYGSILKIDSKGMIETVPVVGSDFLLNYTSNFMPEYYSNYTNVGRQASFNPEGMSLSHVHFLNVAEGRLFLGNGFTSQITSLTSGSDILVPYGDEVFVFNSSGVHTSTRSFLTGFTKYTFHYDANGKLELIEDAFGKETELLRDGSGNLEMIIGPYGDETEIMVNGDGLIETITNPKNETHELYYYIGTSMIESVIYPTGREKFYEYTEAGELRYYERPDGKNIQWFPWLAATEETEIGQLSPTGREDITHVHRDKITNLFTRNTVTPEGFAETYTEGADKSQSIVNGFVAFNKTTQNDPRFGSSKKIDDTLTEVIDGLTRTTVYNDVVSGSGLFSYATLTRESSVNSKTTTSVFNRSTRVETITDPSSVVTTISYNTKEQPVSTNLGSETAVTMTYDGYGRLSQSYQGAKGSNTFTYNAGGLLQKVTNALSQETTYTYDLAGRLKTTTFPDSRVITYWYNDDGMMTGVTPPGRSIHSFGLDLNQNMTSYTPPLLSGMSRSNSVYTYNDEKELTSIERPDLKTIEYNYNATNGLLESVDHDSGSATYAYITDSPILEEAVSIDGVTSEYVPFGTSGIKSEKITKGSHATEVIFARDNFFRTTQRTIKHNSSTKGTVSYAYRDNGQESSVGDLSFGYNSNGRRDEAIIGNLKETWMYDSFGQVSGYLVQYTGAGLPYATVYDICFTRDNMHRILSKIETIGGVSKTYEYTYDTAGRLKTTTVDLTDVYEFFYDSNSNITNVELNSVSVRTATIDGQDRLTATLGNTYV